MFRVCFALLSGLFLIYPQSLIVMALNRAETIQFDRFTDFAVIWTLNFFWVYCLTTHVALWVRKREMQSEEWHH